MMITGAGNLGLALMRYFKGRRLPGPIVVSRGSGPCSCRRYALCDITDSECLEAVFREFRPDAVIHTAALTDVDHCEREPEEARAVNAAGTRNIATLCAGAKIPLVHISTDYVFDGSRGSYTEMDEPAPINVYGRTKLSGEEEVKKGGIPLWAVIRTSFLFDMKGPNYDFVSYVSSALRSGEDINCDEYRYCKPTPCSALGAPIERILSRGKGGIYHICGRDLMTPREAAHRIARHYGSDERLIRGRKAPPAGAATRPRDPGLDTAKAERELDFVPPALEDGL